MLERATTSGRQTPASPPRRGRAGIVAVLVLGLAFSSLLRAWSMEYRERAAGSRGIPLGNSILGNMNSYALALLLGGLRGPLVMFLWTTSENQKTDRDLEDLDAKIKWIRLLQPEFDTVHLFQMWNKAYNISVMMASPANKYSVIMEAIDYGNEVDQERPGDLNILHSLANIYEGKLSAKNLTEAPFYMRQFREESLTEANRLRAFPDDVKNFHRLSDVGPLLDENNDVRKDLLVPTRPRPARDVPGGEWNDGSALQYLASYRHFPYGIGPQAMAYNYAKRAQVAMASEGQKTIQLSAMVIDSQPGILLKMWGEDESDRGHEFVARAYGLSLSQNVLKNSAVMGDLPPDQPIVNREAYDAALLSYALAAQVSRDGLREYHRHLDTPIYAGRILVYGSHLEDLHGTEQISTADHDYFAAGSAAGEQRTKLLQSALENYRKALVTVERNVLDHYTSDRVFTQPDFPQEYNSRAKAHAAPDERIPEIFLRSAELTARLNVPDYRDEREDYGRLIRRAYVRIQLLQKMLESPK